MFNRAFYIARQYWRTTFLHRNVLIFALLMPLIFTFVVGSVSVADNETQQAARLAVVDEDDSAGSLALVQGLRASPVFDVQLLERTAALAQIERDESIAALLIPVGFGEALSQNGAAMLDLRTNPLRAQEAQSVEQEVRRAMATMNGMVQAAGIAVSAAEQLGTADPVQRQAAFNSALRQVQAAWATQAPVEVLAVPVTRLSQTAAIPDGFEQSSPGMLVTFSLVFLLNGTLVLIVERQQGTLRRLLVMPMRKAAIMIGKLGGIYVAGLLQAAILIGAGALLFGVPWGQAPVALLVMVLSFAFSITSLGMLIAGVARTYAQANALANILMYAVAALGGAWWPIEIVPGWMQQLARLTPTYWAMQGFQDIIVRGLGLAAVLPSAALLLLFGAVYLSIGLWRFRYE